MSNRLAARGIARKSAALSMLLVLPARLLLAHGHSHEEYHWFESEYRSELYLQLGVIAGCLMLFCVAKLAAKYFKRRSTCGS